MSVDVQFSAEEALMIARRVVSEGKTDKHASLSMPATRALLEELDRMRGEIDRLREGPPGTYTIWPVLYNECRRWQLRYVGPVNDGYRKTADGALIGTFRWRWQARRAARHLMRKTVEIQKTEAP